MKRQIIRLITLLIFASAISSCSVEYRERHRHHYDDHHDRDHDDHHYRNY